MLNTYYTYGSLVEKEEYTKEGRKLYLRYNAPGHLLIANYTGPLSNFLFYTDLVPVALYFRFDSPTYIVRSHDRYCFTFTFKYLQNMRDLGISFQIRPVHVHPL